jgi:hypothetical protein
MRRGSLQIRCADVRAALVERIPFIHFFHGVRA